LTKVQRVYRIGDIVDIKADGGVHKGMPHKFYHGKTGTVFNVSRRAVGVIVTKRVRGRIINKRVYIRIEHLKPSNSRKEFLERVKLNAQKRKAGDFTGLKRKPAMPEPAKVVEATNPVITLAPKKFVWLA